MQCSLDTNYPHVKFAAQSTAPVAGSPRIIMQTFTNLAHRKACGYVDDRLRRPAPLSPLPEQARKAGKCSPSPTYPQAPQPTREIDINRNITRGSACGPKEVHVKSLDT